MERSLDLSTIFLILFNKEDGHKRTVPNRRGPRYAIVKCGGPAKEDGSKFAAPWSAANFLRSNEIFSVSSADGIRHIADRSVTSERPCKSDQIMRTDMCLCQPGSLFGAVIRCMQRWEALAAHRLDRLISNLTV